MVIRGADLGTGAPVSKTAPPTVVVTGAAGGIGAALAAAAVRVGWVVGMLDRDADAVESAARTVGDAAVALVADITDEKSVATALDRFAGVTGREAPDGLVCNAGIVRFGPLLDLDVDDWRAVAEVNLTGTFVVARAVARRLVAAHQPGSMVMITSINGIAAGPNAGAYGATKAGVARLSQQMALEWAGSGIRVNAVAPGLIDAGMSAPIYADDDIRRRRSAAVPLERLGTAEEIASVVLFLLSDAAAYVTGAELVVDGGVSTSVLATLPRPRSVDAVGPASVSGQDGT